MKIKANPKPKTIKLCKSELVELWNYLVLCDVQTDFDIQGICDKVIVKYHFAELADRIFFKSLALRNELANKQTTIKINIVEQTLLSKMFDIVPCTPYMLQLQTRLIDGLIKITNANNKNIQL